MSVYDALDQVEKELRKKAKMVKCNSCGHIYPCYLWLSPECPKCGSTSVMLIGSD